MPTAAYAPVELGQAVVIPRTTVIRVMPLHFALQRRGLLCNGIVAMLSTPLSDRLERSGQSAAGGFRFHRPQLRRRLAPVPREPQEIERLQGRAAWAGAGKPHQPRLGAVHRQTVFREPGRQRFEQLLGVPFVCAGDDEVVRVTNQDRLPAKSGLHRRLEPVVQHVVQVVRPPCSIAETVAIGCGTMKNSDFWRAFRLLIVFATRYRESSVVNSSLPGPDGRDPGPGGLLRGSTLNTAFCSRTRQNLSCSLGTPIEVGPVLSPRRARVDRPHGDASWSAERLKPRTRDTAISGVDSRTLPVADLRFVVALAVPPTQDSLPARWPSATGWGWLPTGFR